MVPVFSSLEAASPLLSLPEKGNAFMISTRFLSPSCSLLLLSDIVKPVGLDEQGGFFSSLLEKEILFLKTHNIADNSYFPPLF